MAEKSQNNNKEFDRLIEFLIEDLKETGAHLRDTDRKLSLLIQVYTGAFVLIASLSANDIIAPENYLGVPGLVLIVFFIFFTWWLFVYTLRSKETKSVYIRRMNFLRREMHYYLKHDHKDLPGYWTDSKLTNVTEQMLKNIPSISKGIKPKRVGLDDLYPIALQGILVLLSLAFAFVLSANIPEKFTTNLGKWSPFLPYIISLPIIIFILLYTIKQSKNNQKSIEYQIKTYTLSSEELDQINTLKKQQPKAHRAMKKQASNHG